MSGADLSDARTTLAAFFERIAVVSTLLAQAEKTKDRELAKQLNSLAQPWSEPPACDASALQQIGWLARSVEVVDQHDGLFPLIDLKEDDGLPVG